MPIANPVELSCSPTSICTVGEQVDIDQVKVKGQVADSTSRRAIPPRTDPVLQDSRLRSSKGTNVRLNKRAFGGEKAAFASDEFLFSQSRAACADPFRG